MFLFLSLSFFIALLASSVVNKNIKEVVVMQGCNMFVNVYNLNKIIYKGGKNLMRKIEELKKYFDNVDTFYDLEDGQVTNVLLVLRKDNVVYNAEFATDIFRFSPSVVLNHLIRSMDYGTLKSRLISLEERFIADALLEFECECCYVRLLDGVLIADGLRVDLNKLLSFAIEDNVISIVDKDGDIFSIDLIEDEFTWLNNNEEDREISAVIDCIQKYLQ